MPIEVVPSGAALGADIKGVDFSREVTAEQRAEILDAWSRHLVLNFPDQTLDAGQFLDASRIFGDLELSPSARYGKHQIADRPEIAVMSNVVKDGKPVGNLGNKELSWHTDMTYDEKPPNGCILYALETPRTGGETWFANLYASYDELPPELARAIEGRTAIHDRTLNSAGEPRPDAIKITNPQDTPGARHPIVRTHPVTGRKLVFLGRRQNAYIIGLPVEESEQLLDALWAHISQEKYTWAHHWQPGDFLIWDNRATMHRRNELDPNQARTLYRSQIAGEKPY